MRCQEKQTAAYVVTGMAANVEEDVEAGPSDYHTVRIRLDDSPANSAQWSESTDHRALFAKDLYYGDRLETIIDFAEACRSQHTDVPVHAVRWQSASSSV